MFLGEVIGLIALATCGPQRVVHVIVLSNHRNILLNCSVSSIPRLTPNAWPAPVKWSRSTLMKIVNILGDDATTMGFFYTYLLSACISPT